MLFTPTYSPEIISCTFTRHPAQAAATPAQRAPAGEDVHPLPGVRRQPAHGDRLLSPLPQDGPRGGQPVPARPLRVGWPEQRIRPGGGHLEGRVHYRAERVKVREPGGPAGRPVCRGQRQMVGIFEGQ